MPADPVVVRELGSTSPVWTAPDALEVPAGTYVPMNQVVQFKNINNLPSPASMSIAVTCALGHEGGQDASWRAGGRAFLLDAFNSTNIESYYKKAGCCHYSTILEIIYDLAQPNQRLGSTQTTLAHSNTPKLFELQIGY